MKLLYLLFISTFFLFSNVVFADTIPSLNAVSPNCVIAATLRVGAIGEQVKCLQKIVGATVDGRFGPLTKASVVAWQLNHGLLPDGIVGPITRAALFKYQTGSAGEAPLVTSSVYAPKIFGAFPEKVRSGDTVRIYGQNFSSTGNTVRLRYGQIEAKFENLMSADGKVISFVYKPPEVRTMNKEELLNLPVDLLKKLSDPLQVAGGSIDDLLSPYRNMQNEDELKQFLINNGHTFDELYDKFWVTVENPNGKGTSESAILTGMRKLTFPPNFAYLKDSLSSVFDFFSTKKALARTQLGGYNSGIIMYCTCGSGYLTFMTDISSGNGAGLYYWAPGFVPTTGNPETAGPQLGFYVQDGGSCVIIVGNSCSTITANVASLPWGKAP